MQSYAYNEAQMLEGILAYQREQISLRKQVQRRILPAAPPVKAAPAVPFLQTRKARAGFNAVIALVSTEERVSVDLLFNPLRTREVHQARQLATALLYDVLGCPCTDVATLIGQHHTTVLHSVKRVKARCDASPEFAGRYKRLRAQLMAEVR